MDFLASPPLIVFLTCILVGAAFFDLRFHKIPNLLTYPAMLMSLLYHGVTHGTPGILFSLEGLGAGMGFLILFYLLGGMGAGDVKLLGAAGSALGPLGALNAFLFTAFSGGICSLLLILVHRAQFKALLVRCGLMLKMFIATGSVVRIAASSDNEKLPKMAYGLHISCGTLFTLFWHFSYNRFPIDF
ncbi:MAG: prepilin peptidase [bacterium]